LIVKNVRRRERTEMPTFQELLKRVKSEVQEITVHDARRLMENGSGAVMIDVREADEYAQGAVPGALHIPRGFLELRIEDAAPERDRDVILYCAGGVRSALAARDLRALGYTGVRSVIGGFNAWKQAGYEFKVPRFLSAEQRMRYSRHLLIPEVGEKGQLKLLDSSMLLLGAGGLGSPAAMYLAAAGVGRIGIVDDDVVDMSNLQRQILHSEERVGMEKTKSAAQTIKGLNPDVDVRQYPTRLNAQNVDEVLRGYDVVLNGCDNFPTRYLINDACVKHRIPMVDGSIFRFEGQVTVYVPFEGPCYRCLYPQPPPPDLAPSCAEAGVLGVLPGVIGVLQAIEAIKVVLAQGTPLVGRLMQYDALTTKFRELRVRRDPDCPVCADPERPIEYIDYEGFCRIA
jgi:molybdopterin/thiamine biosynthesis adenylyltransferase/rhodanese-related sulfurtransferase